MNYTAYPHHGKRKEGFLIVILGPTGVGKTELCLGVAEHFHIPIINADSRQIFREIPIGTAAPTIEQQARVKHFFVGTHGICDYYSASSYEQDALTEINRQLTDKRLALLTGGSMMYIDAVCNGIDDIPTIRDDIRAEMKRRYAEEGLEPLVEELRQIDPEHYETVDKKNPRRVIHALEICRQTGKTYTSFRKNEKKERPFNIIKIGLNRPREELYDRINRRVNQMIADGLMDEARRMLPFRNENALNTVGFKEIFNFFDGVWQLDEAIERIKGNTRRYCRKQLTWFKRDEDIRWFLPNNVEEIINYIESMV
ncbi:tRNA (adenosine(37)-N6)-dimethylallyltransferase MiaA [Prevotella sp. OH937_COT-195]|uniref:tRNA (adenosine(37)-N6)-dimethylallyltransferase MiaA n=1 Tax=Prevotella sp. OH937_COT-195 TaxID=2491051 RepID=UPI000F64EA69|nr:tRNA (adenosine(37)-N6)-dimethylallyltransferase MiaA [Prevotella sp. OH937_COT-195]RRD02404.1 tRNA (adenosine(37)-N6)-dimethylallyltransferase MiaA [Prevotella sp. OH937_COT-195]